MFAGKQTRGKRKERVRQETTPRPETHWRNPSNDKLLQSKGITSKGKSNPSKDGLQSSMHEKEKRASKLRA